MTQWSNHDLSSLLNKNLPAGSTISVANSKLLKAYADYDPIVKSLMVFIKSWAKNANICDASNGSFSSYAWNNLVIYFLQQRTPSPILPCFQNKSLDEIVGIGHGVIANIAFEVTTSSSSSMKDNDNEDNEDNNTLTSSSSSLSLEELIKEFFIFYAFNNFNKRKLIVDISTLDKAPLECEVRQMTNQIYIRDCFERERFITTRDNGKINTNKELYKAALLCIISTVHQLDITRLLMSYQSNMITLADSKNSKSKLLPNCDPDIKRITNVICQIDIARLRNLPLVHVERNISERKPIVVYYYNKPSSREEEDDDDNNNSTIVRINRERNLILSNFEKCKFLGYHSVEIFYRAHMYPENSIYRETILQCDSSMKAIHISNNNTKKTIAGRNNHKSWKLNSKTSKTVGEALIELSDIKKHIVPNWNDIKYGTMKTALMLKFRNNLKAKKALLATVDKKLIVDDYDYYWNDNNRLGLLLEDVRTIIRNEEEQTNINKQT